MTPEDAIQIGRSALWVACLLGSPILLAALIVGVGVSVVQAATQINEMTLTFIPKLGAAILAFWIMGDWMLDHWLSYATQMWQGIESGGVGW